MKKTAAITLSLLNVKGQFVDDQIMTESELTNCINSFDRTPLNE